MTLENQPTFLQKLLGRNYKWWYLFCYNFKSSTVHRFSTAINVSATLLEVGGILIVWYVNILSGSKILNFSNILTYYIVGNIFKTLSQNNFQGDLSREILSGQIARKLMLPNNIWMNYLCQGMGSDMMSVLMKCVFIILLGLFNWQYFLPVSSWFDLFSFVLLFLIVFTMQIFLSIIFGSIAFFITDAKGIINFANQFDNYTSGKLFPLNVLAQTTWLGILPYSLTFHHPMQIYLGKYNPIETLWVFTGGIVWCIILYFLAKLVFKMGLKRNESVGL